jgi:hypothetical protein
MTVAMKTTSMIRDLRLIEGLRGVLIPLSVLAVTGAQGAAAAQEGQSFPQPTVKPIDPPRIDPSAKFIDHGSNEEFRKQFRIGLVIPQTFSLEDQLATYQKLPVDTQRPMLELGRELFREGPLQRERNLLGDMNPTMWHLMFYGDWRTAAGVSDLGNAEVARLATRLNLDIDFQMTATERIHALVRPFEDGKNLTSWDFTGEAGGDDGRDNDFNLDVDLDAIFFEGDMGPILQGLTGRRNSLDLPFTFGKIPLLFQNGVWLEDAFVGAAATMPALNSPRFDISNMDLTVFAGVDDVSNGSIKNEGVNLEGGTKMVGAAAFIETRSGYAEAGWGYAVNTGGGPDADTHNLSAAWTKRYFDFVSNSTRVIVNFGVDSTNGILLLSENSFRTRQPYTLLPYVNLFAGVGEPQSLARDAGAGGVLKNTGINFEADALTLFPRLDDTGHDKVGGAIGLEYLPNLFSAKHRSQIVLELAALHSNKQTGGDLGDQVGLGVRYQIAIATSWILRADVMTAYVEDGADISGIRFEVRKKW